MKKKTLPIEIVQLTTLVPGGQALGELADGRKVFVWGALPGETAQVQLTKRKSSWAEGVAVEIIAAAPERTAPRDNESYLSTSPWQILSAEAEQEWKAKLVREAFRQEHINVPEFNLQTDGKFYEYRNKMEFSFWWDNDEERLDLAFYRRGTHGKIPVAGSSLARPEINAAAANILALLRAKKVEAYALKTLLIRCDQQGNVSAQLYVKDADFAAISKAEVAALTLQGVQIIYSDPRSPASVATKLLLSVGESSLEDTAFGTHFRYAVDGFFQVNLPVYEQALQAMQKWIADDTEVIDLYSGVGTIGLTIGGDNVTLVETNQSCVNEMERNIAALGKHATAVHANSEDALEYITADKTIIVDPPRAGLHQKIVEQLLAVKPQRIIYLSCNPTTQARDVAHLLAQFDIKHVEAFNFFPRTPHIESLVVLEP